MAAASTIATVAYIYKTTYSTGVGEVALRLHPLSSMITKVSGFTGTTFNYPMRYGNPQGVSNDFPTAQAGATSSVGIQFAATRKKKYGVITLDGEALQACDSKGSFLDLVTLETDSVITEMVDRLSFDLYRDGTGNRGQIGVLATNLVTPVNPDDARNFKIGMSVVASPNANGTSPRVGSTTIAAVDTDAGTVLLTSAAGITSLAVNDYLFAAGDVLSGCIEGLEASTPLVAPTTGDSFRGKDRSVYPSLLAGARVNDTTTTIEENAGLVAVKINQNGGTADSLMLNPVNFYKVARRLNAKVEYEGAGGQADYGFERILIHSPAGTLKAYSDPDCPTIRGRVFKSDSHNVRTLEEFVHIIMDDGRPNLRSTAADSVEARARSMSNYIQTDTRNQGVFAI